jgi:hypothetical protein
VTGTANRSVRPSRCIVTSMIARNPPDAFKHVVELEQSNASSSGSLPLAASMCLISAWQPFGKFSVPSASWVGRALVERHPKRTRMIVFDADERPRSPQLYGVDWKWSAGPSP